VQNSNHRRRDAHHLGDTKVRAFVRRSGADDPQGCVTIPNRPSPSDGVADGEGGRAGEEFFDEVNGGDCAPRDVVKASVRVTIVRSVTTDDRRGLSRGMEESGHSFWGPRQRGQSNVGVRCRTALNR